MKKRFKTILTIILCTGLLLTGMLLTGCGSEDKKSGNSQGGSSETTSQTQIENAAGDNTETNSEVISETEAETASDTDSETASENTSEKESEKTTYVLEFTATTLDNKTMTSEIFAESKLTMVNVWATYCPPCISEMPDLGEISREYDKAKFQIIGIICDVMPISTEDEKQTAIDIIEEAKADYPHLLLNDELYYNLVGASNSVPTTYFFNEKGELLGYLVGARSKENWISIIEELLEDE